MKKIENCKVENCIPTPTSCSDWDGGDIEYLGICNGDGLNNVVWEIITKLQDIAGEDLSTFDIDSLLDICNQNAPAEINLTSILTLIKNNEVCLKDYIDTLTELVNELSQSNNVNVNLKCYADFDNLGNALAITRESLDQLVIDRLCEYKARIENIEGDIITIKQDILAIDVNPTVDELQFATCVDAVIKPTSSQVVSVANELCDLEDATGTPADISSALANTPSDFSTIEFTSLPNWIISPANLADNYNNLLIAFNYLLGRVSTIEDTCCALTCEDVELGFTAIYNEDNTGIIIKFTSGAGTNIPAGFTDIGSTIVITDIDGNTETFTTSHPDLIANNAEIEVNIVGLNLTGDLDIDINANIGTEGLTCSKCLHKTVKKATCNYCEVCAEGTEDATIVVVYETESTTSASIYVTTTSTSTTTTTTVGV